MIPSAEENVGHLKISYVVERTQNGIILLKTLQMVLLQFSIHLPYDPAVLLPSIYPRKMETQTPTKDPIYTQRSVVALSIITKTGNNLKAHQLELMYQMEYYSAINRCELPMHETEVNLKSIMLSQRS